MPPSRPKVLVLVGIAIAVALLDGGLTASAPWEIFGDAAPVKGAPKPNPWAVELSSDNTVAPPTYSGIAFTPSGTGLTFGDLTQLSAKYAIATGDCGGGSPRFQIGIDTNGDGSRDGNLFIYIGPPPSFTSCSTGWQSTGNLIGNTDLRFDTSQLGGTFYDSYALALALVGNSAITGIQIVADGGWAVAGGVQAFNFDEVVINEHTLTARGFKP